MEGWYALPAGKRFENRAHVIVVLTAKRQHGLENFPLLFYWFVAFPIPSDHRFFKRLRLSGRDPRRRVNGFNWFLNPTFMFLKCKTVVILVNWREGRPW